MQMPTTDTQKILDAISGLDTRMGGLEGRMGALESRQDEMIEMMQAYSTDVDARFTRLETEQARMRSVMVDKDYFDRRLVDFKGDIIAALKKGDQRVNTLVTTLKRKRTLTGKEAETVLARPAFVPGRS